MNKFTLFLFTLFAIGVFSCKKQQDVVKPNGLINTISKPDSVWLFNENQDAEGKWLSAGCALNSYTVETTTNNSIQYSGNKFRYYPNGMLSRLTKIDRPTGLPSDSYTTFQYLDNGNLTTFHVYAPLREDTINPISYSAGYQNDVLIASRKHIKVSNNVFNGYLIEEGLYTLINDSLAFSSDFVMNGFKTENKITAIIESSTPLQTIGIKFKSYDVNRPNHVKIYNWHLGSYLFSTGYEYTYNSDGSLSEVYMLDSNANQTIYKKFYWDVNPLNKELIHFFSLQEPFNERLKLFPKEMIFQFSDSTKSIPSKIEEFSNGNLSNTIMYENEIEQDKLTKLTGTHSNGKKEVYTFSYTCN